MWRGQAFRGVFMGIHHPGAVDRHASTPAKAKFKPLSGVAGLEAFDHRKRGRASDPFLFPAPCLVGV
jgi:hypothetical protein